MYLFFVMAVIKKNIFKKENTRVVCQRSNDEHFTIERFAIVAYLEIGTESFNSKKVEINTSTWR